MARILVAEDDLHQLSLRQALLQAAGHDVRIAATVGDIRRQLEADVPDVLMMDLNYPDVNGEPDSSEALELIRDTRTRRPELPVIVISGWPERLRGHPDEKLVNRIVAKPYRLQTLLDAIQEVLALLFCLVALAGCTQAATYRFVMRASSEAIADLEMSSPASDWAVAGREAALATLTLEGKPEQHLLLYRANHRHTYSAFLGRLEAGEHTLRVERNAKFSAPGSELQVHAVKFREIAPDDPYSQVLAHAPVLYARADTVGKFTDVPLLTYCERLVEDGKPLLQYTTIFSNEDGGTSTRALMARWGRTTDIEYVYKAWLGNGANVARATIQSKDHKEIDFDGRYDGTHPVLIPTTLNNMVSGKGESEIRYQLPPELVDLNKHSREEVMDRHPWTYGVMAKELEREGKIRPFGEVRGESIGDVRNYLFIEAKTVNRSAALAIWVQLKNDAQWRSSHLGRSDYGVVRSGRVRSTVELPPGTRPQDVAAIGFECLVESAKPAPVAGSCRVEGLSKSFFLQPDYRPGVRLFAISEAAEIPSGQMRVFPVSLQHVARAGP